MQAINPDFLGFPKWSKMLAKASWPESETTVVDFAHWSGICEAVKRKANTFRYIPDVDWDTWSTPLEFEHEGGGDCEDFAIWCYGEMLRNGIPDFDLEVCVGYAAIRGEEIVHAVLCASFDTQGPLGTVTNVLDCLQSHVVTEEWLLRYFRPEYYINRLGWAAA